MNARVIAFCIDSCEILDASGVRRSWVGGGVPGGGRGAGPGAPFGLCVRQGAGQGAEWGIKRTLHFLSYPKHCRKKTIQLLFFFLFDVRWVPGVGPIIGSSSIGTLVQSCTAVQMCVNVCITTCTFPSSCMVWTPAVPLLSFPLPLLPFRRGVL